MRHLQQMCKWENLKMNPFDFSFHVEYFCSDNVETVHFDKVGCFDFIVSIQF